MKAPLPLSLLFLSMTLFAVPVCPAWAQSPGVQNACPFKDQKDFLRQFADNSRIQRDYTIDPLQKIEMVDSFPVARILKKTDLVFPLLPSRQAREKQMLRTEEELTGPDMMKLTLHRDDAKTKTMDFFFQRQSQGDCWALYRLEDRFNAYPSKADERKNGLTALFPSVNKCEPGFAFEVKPLVAVTRFWAAKGYPSPAESGPGSASFKIRELFYGLPATGFSVFVPEESVYTVTVAAPARQLAGKIEQNRGETIRIYPAAGPDPADPQPSGVAYLVDRGANETLFVCPVGMGL